MTVRPTDTLAVIVGVEQYAAGKPWGLDGPALDACRFAAWLTGRGVPADRITLLVSPLPENEGAVAEQSRGFHVRPGRYGHGTGCGHQGPVQVE